MTTAQAAQEKPTSPRTEAGRALLRAINIEGVHLPAVKRAILAIEADVERHEPIIFATNTEDGYLRCSCGWPDRIEEGHFTEHFRAAAR